MERLCTQALVYRKYTLQALTPPKRQQIGAARPGAYQIYNAVQIFHVRYWNVTDRHLTSTQPKETRGLQRVNESERRSTGTAFGCLPRLSFPNW